MPNNRRFKLGDMVYTTYFPDVGCTHIVNLGDGRGPVVLGKIVKIFSNQQYPVGYVLTFPENPRAGWDVGTNRPGDDPAYGLPAAMCCWKVDECQLIPVILPPDYYKVCNRLDLFPMEGGD